MSHLPVDAGTHVDIVECLSKDENCPFLLSAAGEGGLEDESPTSLVLLVLVLPLRCWDIKCCIDVAKGSSMVEVLELGDGTTDGPPPPAQDEAGWDRLPPPRVSWDNDSAAVVALTPLTPRDKGKAAGQGGPVLSPDVVPALSSCPGT